MTTCLIGLGSNLGDRQQTLDRAVQLLREDPELRVVAVSSFRPTRAVGGPPGQAEYLNGAVVLETALGPQVLWARLEQVELNLGRDRRTRWAPRTIDLDLLLHGDSVIAEPPLQVPHPRMAFRRFVMEPAAEIASDLVHPTIGWTIGRLAEHLRSSLPYIAIAGPSLAQKTRLAEEVLAQLPGRLIQEPGQRERRATTDAPVHGGRVEIPFITQMTWALAADLQEDPTTLAVSNFWFEECLAYASTALAPEKLAEFEAAIEAARERVMPPKLLVVLDSDAETVLEEITAKGVPEEQPWRRAARLDELEEIRTAIFRRANRPGLGPVLALPATQDLSAPVTETVAAIAAMPSE